MGVGYNRSPDPYQARDNSSHAAIFLVALLLPVVVAGVLFFGNAWIFSSGDLSVRAAAAATAVPQRTAPNTSMVFSGPTAIAPLARIAFQPITVAPATPLPNVAPTAVASNAVMSSLVVTPVPIVSLSGVAHIGNTGGDGAFLRHTTMLADTWIAWPDRTPLTLTGAEADGDGQHWLQVQDPKHNVGWIPSQYVVR
jgi:hypothetical protein